MSMHQSVLEQLSDFIDSIPVEDGVSIQPSIMNAQTIIDYIAALDFKVPYVKDGEKVVVLIRCTFDTTNNFIITQKIWVDDMEVGSALDEETRDRIAQVLAEKL